MKKFPGRARRAGRPAAQSPAEPLALPYQISEAPRLLLHLLKNSSKLDDAMRHFIANWLIGYDQCVLEFMVDTYGPRAVFIADAITTAVHTNMAEAFAEACSRSAAQSFAKWTEELAAEDPA
jgi:hypothetical protein